MTIAVDLGCKATKQTKDQLQMYHLMQVKVFTVIIPLRQVGVHHSFRCYSKITLK